MKRIISVLFVICMLLSTVSAYADDNAGSGEGDTSDTLEGKGFCRSSEYMYKVSVYVGLSDTADESSDLMTDWREIGQNPLYVKPGSFTLPSGVLGGTGNKVDYLNGLAFSPVVINEFVTDSPPPIPITHGGNINSVKSYFGDTATLLCLLDGFALQLGQTREGLVEGLMFSIDGEMVKNEPERILQSK